MSLLALALLAATAQPPAAAYPFGLENAVVVQAATDHLLVASASDPEPVPPPDEARGGRINATHGHFHTHYKLDERTFGFAIQPSYVMLEGGKVVQSSFSAGPGITARFIANLPGGAIYVDFAYSHHAMRNPRAMLFRTAYTQNSSYSGEMSIFAPAVYYAYTFPIGEDFHRRAFLMPKLYVGLGPMITIANGRITNAGSKGTVTGQGNQPFFQFTPGFGVDFRVPGIDYAFVGLDARYRLTLPTSRPTIAHEFSIPTIYTFEPALNLQYMFY